MTCLVPPPPVELIEFRSVGRDQILIEFHWRRWASVRWLAQCYIAQARELGISLWDPWLWWRCVRAVVLLLWAGP